MSFAKVGMAALELHDEYGGYRLAISYNANVVSVLGVAVDDETETMSVDEFASLAARMNDTLQAAPLVPVGSIVVIPQTGTAGPELAPTVTKTPVPTTEAPIPTATVPPRPLPTVPPESWDEYEAAAFLFTTTGPLQDWSSRYNTVFVPPHDSDICGGVPTGVADASSIFDNWLQVEASFFDPDTGDTLLQATGLTYPIPHPDDVVRDLNSWGKCTEPFAEHGIHSFSSGPIDNLPFGITEGIFWSFGTPDSDVANAVLADLSFGGDAIMTIRLTKADGAATLDDLQPWIDLAAERFLSAQEQ